VNETFNGWLQGIWYYGPLLGLGGLFLLSGLAVMMFFRDFPLEITAAPLEIVSPADGAVVILDPDSGAVVRRLEVPGWQSREQQEGYLAVLPGGALVASAPAAGELWLLDGSGAAPPRLLHGGLPGVTGVALLPDGELLVALTWEHRLIRVAGGP
jgi:hypothetical protein